MSSTFASVRPEWLSGVKPGPCERACDLAAEIGDVAGRTVIGGRGEQTDDLHAARRPAVAEMLDPDHIHRHLPVHPRARAGLGDQHRAALFEGSLRPRRHFDAAAADRTRLERVGAQHAERRARNPGEHATVGFQPVFANAEEGEVVVLEPFEESDGLGDLVLGQRRRVGLERIDDAADAIEHRAPVLHREAHVGDNAGKRIRECGPRGFVVDAVDVNLDDAFAQRRGVDRRCRNG